MIVNNTFNDSFNTIIFVRKKIQGDKYPEILDLMMGQFFFEKLLLLHQKNIYLSI